MTSKINLSILTCALACASACVTGDDVADTETGSETGDDGMSLEIVGTWDDQFGDVHTISDEQWSNAAGTFEIAEWKNDADWLVAQNGAGNEFSPELWSRFDWSWDGDNLYYCQSVFDGATIDDAVLGSADRTDLDMGCGGFAWTLMTPQ